MSYKEDHPELSSAYDAEAFTASIRKYITPGSEWSHKNGNEYTVLMLTNTESDDHYRYPPTVIYRGKNGYIWSRKASDWDRSMTRLPVRKWRKLTVLLALVSALLTGCSLSVDPRDVSRAHIMCEMNRGVRSVTISPGSGVEVFCNNGAMFEFTKLSYKD